MQEQENEPDWYKYTLAVPMASEPGKKAVYCSSNANLAGGVLSRATGKTLEALFQDLIAAPMQINRYHLILSPTGEPYMGGGIRWLPRDFMKLGQLMLNGGVWNGRRILSKAWVRTSLRKHYEIGGRGYGYLWWKQSFPYRDGRVDVFFAGGNGGNAIVAVPKLGLVIATFGGNYSDRSALLRTREFIPKYILPAVIGDSESQ